MKILLLNFHLIYLQVQNNEACLQEKTAENERKVRRKIGRIRKHVDGKTADGVSF